MNDPKGSREKFVKTFKRKISSPKHQIDVVKKKSRKMFHYKEQGAYYVREKVRPMKIMIAVQL